MLIVKNYFVWQIFSIVFLLSSTITFSQSMVRVTESNLHGWEKNEQYLGKIRFTNGPSKPPLHKGSIEFDAPVNGHARQVRMRNSNYSGILLSTITELSYATYVQKAGSKWDVPLLVLLVDIDGDGKAGKDGIKDGDVPHITFIPRFQNVEDTTGYPVKYGWYRPKKTNDKGIRWQHQVRQNAWQTWDLLHGGWVNWTIVNNTVDTSPALFSLASFIAQHPNARIINDKRGGGVRIQAGGPDMSDNFVGNADAFTIGINGKTTVYDFEMDSVAPLDKKVNFVNALQDYTGINPDVSPATIINSTVVQVTEISLDGWVKDEEHLGKIYFTNGPLITPLKKGSLEFYAPENGHGRFVRMENSAHSGTLLSSLTQLTYSTFIQKSGSKYDVPFIVLLVDADGDGAGDTHMFFDPRFQNPKDTNGIPTRYGWYKPIHTNDQPIKLQGPIRQKVWQTWDALHGGWVTWSMGASKGDTTPSVYSLTGFIAKNPKAQIVNDKSGGGVRLQAGGIPMANHFIGNVDAFTIGINGKTTVYDFEVDADTVRK